MPDPVARLNAALEGRYAIERELGEGGHGHGLPGRRPQARAQGRAEGPRGVCKETTRAVGH